MFISVTSEFGWTFVYDITFYFFSYIFKILQCLFTFCILYKCAAQYNYNINQMYFPPKTLYAFFLFS